MATSDIKGTDFKTKVLENKLSVLVDFWAPWCGPCRLSLPILDELSEVNKDKMLFYKVNVDEEGEIAQKYGVMSIPTTILFKQGKEIGRHVGFAGKEAFEDLIKKGI